MRHPSAGPVYGWPRARDTNLFRDQLDRYSEIDALARRIGEAIVRSTRRRSS
jgi:hypothetical protein